MTTAAVTAANDAAANILPAVASTDLSMMTLFFQADFVVKAVMLLLLAASVWCWAIIIDKKRHFRRVDANSKRFERSFRAAASLQDLFRRIAKNTDTPMAAMFVAAMQEAASPVKIAGLDSAALMTLYKERMAAAISRVRHNALDRMEKDLIILATVGSAGPFIGLFGTVWGIMNSFQSIAASKNTSLAVVAPGIAEALFATAIGLFAAIPAVMFYNLFSNFIRRYAGRLDDFAAELEVLLVSTIEKK